LKTELENAIQRWNGKSASDIKSIYQQFEKTPDFIESLISLCQYSEYQKGATWLIKHHLEKPDNQLSKEQGEQLISSASELDHWEAKLHLLQFIQYINIPESCVGKLEDFIRVSMKDDAKFVRAWAYSSFHTLANQYPEYREEAIFILETSLDRESAASIKARIRNVLKQGFE